MAEQNIIIREAGNKDIVDVARIASECFPNDYKVGGAQHNSEEISKNWIKSRLHLKPFSFVFVAEEKESKRIVGFAIFLMMGGLSGVIELELIGVDQKYRRKGVGSLLMTESESVIASHIQKRFSKSLYKFLLTTSMENPDSHSFYKKHGYVMTGNLGMLYWNTEEAVYTKTYQESE